MNLVGTWSLVGCRIETGGADPILPFGRDPQGQLVYADDGGMSAILSRGCRAPLGAGLEGSHRADPAAKARAFDGCLAYAGRWHIDGDCVVHDVRVALVPDIVGRHQRRTVRIDGDHLELSYADGPRRYVLDWRRP